MIVCWELAQLGYDFLARNPYFSVLLRLKEFTFYILFVAITGVHRFTVSVVDV